MTTFYFYRFSFHDGIISEICPDESEDDWVLNFKRAILSLFQNSMKRFDINFKGVEVRFKNMYYIMFSRSFLKIAISI